MKTKHLVTIPMPLQVVVDDVGWWSGRDGSAYNQPFRTAMGRDHLPQDYGALVRLGKKLAMKILAGFVLCEWDRQGILKHLPSATWMGRQWSVDWVNQEHLERAGGIIKQAAHHLEIALHGIGHEFWTGSTMHRAEFHDQWARMRHPDEIRRHLDCFFRIMDHHGLSPQPTTFIPPAMKHSFGNGDKGIQKLLKEAGIRQVTACFQKARHLSSPRYPTVTWESGVVILDRGEANIPWNAIAATPRFGFDRPLLVLHWANILHKNPDRNPLVVDAWVDFIQKGAQEHGVLLSPNTDACFTQYLYRVCSKIHRTPNGVCIDISRRHTLPFNALNGPFAVRVNLPGPLVFRVVGARVAALGLGGGGSPTLPGKSLGQGQSASLIFLVPHADHVHLKLGV
ncbi:MAG: hypothetical protein JEZ12_01450 [Desulfobacterium sp.]|nr:hypothetical protein [Desulfobacterium sp.]